MAKDQRPKIECEEEGNKEKKEKDSDKTEIFQRPVKKRRTEEGGGSDGFEGEEVQLCVCLFLCLYLLFIYLSVCVYNTHTYICIYIYIYVHIYIYHELNIRGTLDQVHITTYMCRITKLSTYLYT